MLLFAWYMWLKPQGDIAMYIFNIKKIIQLNHWPGLYNSWDYHGAGRETVKWYNWFEKLATPHKVNRAPTLWSNNLTQLSPYLRETVAQTDTNSVWVLILPSLIVLFLINHFICSHFKCYPHSWSPLHEPHQLLSLPFASKRVFSHLSTPAWPF